MATFRIGQRVRVVADPSRSDSGILFLIGREARITNVNPEWEHEYEILVDGYPSHVYANADALEPLKPQPQTVTWEEFEKTFGWSPKMDELVRV